MEILPPKEEPTLWSNPLQALTRPRVFIVPRHSTVYLLGGSQRADITEVQFLDRI